MNKDEIIEAMARDLNIARRKFPNKQTNIFNGCKIKPTAEQYRDAEVAFNALIQQLPIPTDGNPNFANALYERASLYQELIDMKKASRCEHEYGEWESCEENTLPYNKGRVCKSCPTVQLSQELIDMKEEIDNA